MSVWARCDRGVAALPAALRSACNGVNYHPRSVILFNVSSLTCFKLSVYRHLLPQSSSALFPFSLCSLFLALLLFFLQLILCSWSVCVSSTHLCTSSLSSIFCLDCLIHSSAFNQCSIFLSFTQIASIFSLLLVLLPFFWHLLFFSFSPIDPSVCSSSSWIMKLLLAAESWSPNRCLRGSWRPLVSFYIPSNISWFFNYGSSLRQREK